MPKSKKKTNSQWLAELVEYEEIGRTFDPSTKRPWHSVCRISGYSLGPNFQGTNPGECEAKLLAHLKTRSVPELFSHLKMFGGIVETKQTG